MLTTFLLSAAVISQQQYQQPLSPSGKPLQVVNGVPVDPRELHEPHYMPNAIANKTVGWYKIAPIRPGYYNPRLGKLLSEIESQLKPGHKYSDPDLITWAHESTHAINSRLRNELGVGMNVFYTFDNTAIIMHEPRIRKHQIAQFVPAEYRGNMYKLYILAAREWDDKPLYVCDEWDAYINGALVGKELEGRRNSQRTSYSDINNATELMHHSYALLRTVDAYDSNYADRNILVDYINFNTKRTQQLQLQLKE